MSLNFFKLKLLVREFPFLRPFINKEIEDDGRGSSPVKVINSIVVKRADDSLLNSKAWEDSWSWNGGPGHHHYLYATAVWSNGTIMNFKAVSKIGIAGEAEGEYDAPTIGEQLFNVELPAPEFIVVRRKQDHDDWGHGAVVRDITIYKVGNFDLADYYARKIDEAAAELKAELARMPA